MQQCVFEKCTQTNSQNSLPKWNKIIIKRTKKRCVLHRSVSVYVQIWVCDEKRVLDFLKSTHVSTRTDTHKRDSKQAITAGVRSAGSVDSIGSWLSYLYNGVITAPFGPLPRSPALCVKSRLAPLRLHATAARAWWEHGLPGDPRWRTALTPALYAINSLP